MVLIKHRFSSYVIHPDTETLLIGTFNPETKNNEADFFYGRTHNFLWTLLPSAFNEKNLKGASKSEKEDFISRHKIDFTDLILKVKVEEGQESNYSDNYIDGKVYEWKDIVSEIKTLAHLKRIGFTRSTFSGIPNIKIKIGEVERYCKANTVFFENLLTPARIYNKEKQNVWSSFLSKF